MTNLDKLIEQQRALKKQIRDAKRAAVQRERQALARAKTDLGNRLAEAMNASTVETVRAIGDLLDTEQVRHFICARLAADQAANENHADTESTAPHHGADRADER